MTDETALIIAGGRRVAYVPAQAAAREGAIRIALADSAEAAAAALEGLAWSVLVDLDGSVPRIRASGEPPVRIAASDEPELDATAYADTAPIRPAAGAADEARVEAPIDDEDATSTETAVPEEVAPEGPSSAPAAVHHEALTETLVELPDDDSALAAPEPVSALEPASVLEPEEQAAPAPEVHEEQSALEPEAHEPQADPDDGPAPAEVPVVRAGDHDGSTMSIADLRALRAQEAGDHDGATMSIADLRAARAAEGAARPEPAEPAAPAPTRGHRGRVRLSTGETYPLDRALIVGRSPRAYRVAMDEVPRLVAVESPQYDISRNHLEILPEADAVVVADLRTTNGTRLLRGGADPVRLRPNERMVVVSGDVLDLGDGVTVAFEDLS